jgi:hypothetical protein
MADFPSTQLLEPFLHFQFLHFQFHHRRFALENEKRRPLAETPFENGFRGLLRERTDLEREAALQAGGGVLLDDVGLGGVLAADASFFSTAVSTFLRRVRMRLFTVWLCAVRAVVLRMFFSAERMLAIEGGRGKGRENRRPPLPVKLESCRIPPGKLLTFHLTDAVLPLLSPPFPTPSTNLP